MSARVDKILGRLPAHMEAARPDKLLYAVTQALAFDLDTLSAEIGAVRRAHRLGHAGVLRDVLRLGALHGIDNRDLDVLFARASATAALLDAPAVGALLELLGVDWAAAVERAAPGRADSTAARLALFAPPLEEDPSEEESAPPDPLALARLRLQIHETLRYGRQTDLVRERIRTIAAIHARGNGTVRALLEGAANALDLDIDVEENARVRAALATANADADTEGAQDLLDIGDGLFHSADRYWHATYVRDRIRLERPLLADPPGETEDLDTPLAKLSDVARLRADETEITLGELARRMVVSPESTIEHARTQPGLADATLATTVDPTTAARIAARFGVRLFAALPHARELLGIEENPKSLETRGPFDRVHGDLDWSVRRRGFGEAKLEVHLTGIGERTVGPMVVHRDAAHGLGFAGSVPDGQTLIFRDDGRALLDGVDVTDRAYAWTGACFADAVHLDSRDFVLGGDGYAPGDRRVATFAVGFPAGALDARATFPHSGASLPVPPLEVGITRLAYFVQQAHHSACVVPPESPADADCEPDPVEPRPAVGFFDASVFATRDAEGEPLPVSASVVLAWREREGYVVRAIVPARFAHLDAALPGAEPSVAARVATALERFRPAGVEVRVEYLSDTWTLGEGLLPKAAIQSPIDILRGSSTLAPTPEE